MTLTLLTLGWKEHAIFCSFALIIVITFKPELYMAETEMKYPKNHLGLFCSFVNVFFLCVFLPAALMGEIVSSLKR
jgi:hypothetical protein